MKKEKYLVVGAGLSGATVARVLAENGKSVIVYDKRETIGGNAYDEKDKNGILVQPYGPHVFHTDSKRVFDFLSQFTEWKEYRHKVLAFIKGKLVPVPFNLNSLSVLYSKEKAEKIKEILVAEYGMNGKVYILDLKKHSNPEIRKFAEFVYENVFYTYTKKQWGIKPEELGGEVMTRVPVSVSYDDGYFADAYQYMPKKGFTETVANMLKHPNIQLRLGKDALKSLVLKDGTVYLDGGEFDGNVVWTGCVDELFGYKFGELPYRSLNFKFKTKKTASYQEAAVINYTTSAKFTRISEFTKFTCAPQKKRTVIVKEFPTAFKKGKNEPYYPIPASGNELEYEKYKAEAAKYKNLYLLGRLATYKYINMDQAVKNALELCDELLKEENVVVQKEAAEVQSGNAEVKAKKKSSAKKTATKKEKVQETISEKEVVEPEKPKKQRALGKWVIEKKSEGEYVAVLSATNKEVMLTSEIYATEKGARSGIETLVKNVKETGKFEIYKDKNNNYYYKLKNANNRLLCVGEIYKSKDQCEKAVESVKRIVNAAQIAEELVVGEGYVEYLPQELNLEEKKGAKGKWVIEKDEDGKFVAKLFASNGQLMLCTEDSVAEETALAKIEAVKKNALDGNFVIDRDKFGRFYYKLRNAQKTLICIGEAYEKVESVKSAIESVRRFSNTAVIVPAEEKEN